MPSLGSTETTQTEDGTDNLVRLLQATKIPAGLKKMVHGTVEIPQAHYLSLFAPH